MSNRERGTQSVTVVVAEERPVALDWDRVNLAICDLPSLTRRLVHDHYSNQLTRNDTGSTRQYYHLFL